MLSLVEIGQWFCRRKFLNFVNVLLLFRNYLPLKKGGAFHLNKLESTSPKDALCQVWLKVAQWFWKRGYYISSMHVCFFITISLGRGRGPSFVQTESPLPKNALCQVWLILAKWFWWRRWKCEKFTTTTRTTTTDNGHIVIRKAPLSLRLRWVKKDIWRSSNSFVTDKGFLLLGRGWGEILCFRRRGCYKDRLVQSFPVTGVQLRHYSIEDGSRKIGRIFQHCRVINTVVTPISPPPPHTAQIRYTYN